MGYCNNLLLNVWLGGRVAPASNKQYHVKKIIADFDACSLYPSAMYKMNGFLEGKPKILRNTSYEFLKQQYCFFSRAKHIKLNKHSNFPLISKVNEETGVIYFKPEMDNDITHIYIYIYIHIYILTKLA